jgi:serine/threonine-protein kinase SRPK3
MPNPASWTAAYQILRYWPLNCVLHDKYLFPNEADAITSFLTPMLHLHPDKRAKASDLVLVHPNWLDGVLVQGEVDVIRRAEEDEARRRRREAAGGDMSTTRGDMSPNSKLKAILDQSEADAMKPVDDIAVLSDTDKVGAPPSPQVYHPPTLSNAPVPSSGVKENTSARPTSSGSTGAPTVSVAAASSSRSRPKFSTKPSSATKR